MIVVLGESDRPRVTAATTEEATTVQALRLGRLDAFKSFDWQKLQAFIILFRLIVGL